MAAFEIPEGPRSINGGACRYNIVQMLPRTAAVSGTRPGISGATQGLMTFDWNEDILWWLPSMSYFEIRAHMAVPTTLVSLARTAGIAYVDCWPAALFSQIQYYVNGGSVDLLQFPPQAEAASLYSSVDKTWLKSSGSAQGAGEALTTRILNSSQFGTASASTSNINEIVATWRPPVSIFSCPHCLPPGAQHKVDFTWSPTGEINMIESLASVTTASNVQVYIDSFYFYKATLVPDASIPLPMRGYIELNPMQINTYQITGGTTLNQNVTIPPTTTRILVGFQDNNVANSLAAGQNGLKPITSFAAAFSNGATDLSAYIQNLYVNMPDLGYQFPNPQYTLTAGSATGAKTDWDRAFQDWLCYTRGLSGGFEGSVPFGAFDTGIGAAVLAYLASTPGATFGDPNNDQQAWIASVATTAVSLTQSNQTALWGWLGRCPGPIFAFPVVRPPDRFVSNAQLNVTLSGSATSVTCFIMSSYTKGLAVEADGSGKYRYTLVDGL